MAQQSYEKAKDNRVWSNWKPCQHQGDTHRILVGVYKYNDGELKIGVSRFWMDAQGKWRIGKLGRFLLGDALTVSELIQEALAAQNDLTPLYEEPEDNTGVF